jgi:hypothetical protein
MIIMPPIPELNEERRTQLTKVAGTYAENGGLIRNVRRDGMDQIKKSQERWYVRGRPEWGRLFRIDHHIKLMTSLRSSRQIM